MRYFWSVLLLGCLGLAWAGELESVPVSQTAVYEAQYQSGDQWQTIGRVIAWSGVGSLALGVASDQGALVSLGFFSTIGGVAVNGWGGAKMVRALNNLEPRGHAVHPGWWPLGASVGAFVGGCWIAMFADSYEDSEGDTHYTGEIAGINQMELGAGLVMAGALGLFVTANAYSEFADQARIAHRYLKFSASPLVLQTHENSGLAQGLQLNAAF